MNDSLKKDLIHLGGALLAITVVVALCLGCVDALTRDKIAALKEQQVKDAMGAVCGTDATFEPLEADIDDETIQDAYQIIRNGSPDGICVQVAPSGYGGEITMIVGVSGEGAVLGVQIVNMSETAGLGANAEKPEFLQQYEGQQGDLTVVKSATGAEGEIVALSGATITSNGVTSGVQSALDLAASLAQ